MDTCKNRLGEASQRKSEKDKKHESNMYSSEKITYTKKTNNRHMRKQRRRSASQ